MPDLLQATFYIRTVKIETLCKRLTEVTNQQEKDDLLEQLELVTGVKIFY
ncbi:MAG: hypothetical protein AAGD09_24050 [Cyanobacteria bacterium P01_F01_bin.56]